MERYVLDIFLQAASENEIRICKKLSDEYLESLPTCLKFNESARAAITTAEIIEAFEQGRKNVEAVASRLRNWNSQPYPNVIMR